jgi:hypothetical protein
MNKRRKLISGTTWPECKDILPLRQGLLIRGAGKIPADYRKGTSSDETSWIHKDGSRIYVILSSTPLDRNNLENFDYEQIHNNRKRKTVSFNKTEE